MTTIIVVASGPSLTLQQCAVVSASGLPVVAVNNAAHLLPCATWFYSGDLGWWKHYGGALQAEQVARCVTSSPIISQRYGPRLVPVDCSGGNSGVQALLFAAGLPGVSRLLMVGFDFQHTQGRAHFFGDHPPGMINAAGHKLWLLRLPAAIKEITATGVALLNCTAATAIPDSLIPRMTLEDALA